MLCIYHVSLDDVLFAQRNNTSSKDQFFDGKSHYSGHTEYFRNVFNHCLLQYYNSIQNTTFPHAKTFKKLNK